MKAMKKTVSLILAVILALSLCVFGYAAPGPTIDTSKTASLNIYKYDLTSAEAAGAWDAGAHVSSGVYDSSVNDALGGAVNYAIKGVKFTYLKVADIATYTSSDGSGQTATTVYAMPVGSTTTSFLTALGLSYENAHHQTEDIYYFTSDTLISALEKALADNSTVTKNALETYIGSNGGVTMPETDEYGHSSASGLPLGLYLLVETAVPENVTSTTDPFLVSLPMTSIDGASWNYDVTVYPKNNTGAPTLEKTVREASASTGKNTGAADSISDGYAHTATGSDGDVMQYQIISTLPTITSAASQLTTYTFVDNLSQGLAYNQNDVVIEFFKDKSCTDKITTWAQSEGKFSADYTAEDGGAAMTITMTGTGLSEINTSTEVYGPTGQQQGYSACTMRITYSATIHSDASVVYGNTGNPNNVTLTWRRTNAEYYDTLKDDCHVYVYGLDLTKQFSDGAGHFENVKMLLHNDTDNYYVQATQQDGIYFVTGHTTEEAQATVFIPTAEGKIIVKGLEDDAYSITETATDDGFVLLREAVKVVITTAEGTVCDVCKKPMLTASATVNGNAAEMAASNESANAFVTLTVVNTKGFDLPQTGGRGTWLYTTIGIVVMAGDAAAIFVFSRRRSHR